VKQTGNLNLVLTVAHRLYRGTTDNTVVNSLGEVAPNKCLAQAALTEGAQVMTACSTLALVIRVRLDLLITGSQG